MGNDTKENLMSQAQYGPKFSAVSTGAVYIQKSKFVLPLRTNSDRFEDQNKEDVLKNLFKIFCGIMKMGLKQRGINVMDS